MSKDLESRIKALEDRLTPPPDKMSTMKASNRLKQYLVDLEKGTQEDAVWWLIDEAEKVPGLEKRIRELDDEIELQYCKLLRYCEKIDELEKRKVNENDQ